MASNRSTFQSASYSYSSSSVNGHTTSRSEAMYSDPSGTRVHRTAQDPGQRPREERLEYDAGGRRIADSAAGPAPNNRIEGSRIEEITDEEAENARQYHERMEDEYAKREGGA